MKIAIAHAAFLLERAATLDRLVSELLPAEAEVFVSARREHAAVWARRLWEYAGDDAIVCLNDDVRVCPDFEGEVDRMVRAVPDQVIALHTTAPVAASLAMCGAKWLRSYWVTGPGYILPPGAARRLLAWAETTRGLRASVNEDNLIMHWLWHEQRPAWHSIPAIVQHDTSVPSSLGYDNHPLRSSNVPWTLYELPASWEPDGDPILVECPWMTRERLRSVEFALMNEQGMCCFCLERPSVAASPTGAGVCGRCLVSITAAVVGKVAQ